MEEIANFFDWESSPPSAQCGEDGECTETGGEFGLSESEYETLESEKPQDNADWGGSEDGNNDEDEGRDDSEDGREDKDRGGSKVSKKRGRPFSFSQSRGGTISGNETDSSLPRVIKRVRPAMPSGTAHSPIRIDSPRMY